MSTDAYRRSNWLAFSKNTFDYLYLSVKTVFYCSPIPMWVSVLKHSLIEILISFAQIYKRTNTMSSAVHILPSIYLITYTIGRHEHELLVGLNWTF